MSASNYNKVGEFHELFEHPTEHKPVLNVFTKNPKLLSLRLALINEEVQELHEAVENGDFTETIDALSDILYVVYGMGHSIGVDLDKSFDIVHKSNMSKLCQTEEQAKETCVWLKEYKPEYNPAYRKTKDGSAYLIYDSVTGKVLKSKYYTPADFKSMLS